MTLPIREYKPADQLNYELRKYGFKYGLDFGTSMTDSVQKIDWNKLRNYRLERARVQMEKDGLGSILVYQPWNIRYITSFNVLIYCRTLLRFYALLPRNGDPILWAVGMASEVYEEEMPWLKGNVRLCKAPITLLTDATVYTGTFEKEIADILHEHGINNEPLGIDIMPSGSAAFSLPRNFQSLGVKLVDGSKTMDQARKIKSLEEIELIRMSHVFAEAALCEAASAIKPGVAENELQAIILKTLLSKGAEWMDGTAVCSGPNTNPNRRNFSDRIIRPHDMIFIDIAGSQFCGYRTCVYRNFTCGKATQEQKEIYAGAREMLYAGMNMVREGNTTLDIIDQWPEPEHWGYKPEEEDMVWENAMGHGLGLSQNDIPMIFKKSVKASPIKLEENMVIALEVWEGKRNGIQGCRLENVVAVKKDGYDLLSTFPDRDITECWV